jgi:hypothetical protein
MAGMRPEEAKDFYEEDEDPARVFALFDAAERQGKLERTEPPSARQELVPLHELLAALAAELRRDLRELQLRERLALLLERAARAMRSHHKVG